MTNDTSQGSIATSALWYPMPEAEQVESPQ
jgi:hypothetical protein